MERAKSYASSVKHLSRWWHNEVDSNPNNPLICCMLLTFVWNAHNQVPGMIDQRCGKSVFNAEYAPILPLVVQLNLQTVSRKVGRNTVDDNATVAVETLFSGQNAICKLHFVDWITASQQTKCYKKGFTLNFIVK